MTRLHTAGLYQDIRWVGRLVWPCPGCSVPERLPLPVAASGLRQSEVLAPEEGLSFPLTPMFTDSVTLCLSLIPNADRGGFAGETELQVDRVPPSTKGMFSGSFQSHVKRSPCPKQLTRAGS